MACCVCPEQLLKLCEVTSSTYRLPLRFFIVRLETNDLSKLYPLGVAQAIGDLYVFFVQQLQSAANYFTSMPDTTKRVFAPLRNTYRWSGATKLFHLFAVTEAFRVLSGACLPVMVFTSISWSIISVTAVYLGKFLLANTPHKFPNNFPFTNFLFTYLTYNAALLLFLQTMTSLALTPESRSAANAAGHVIFY